jgi:tetratricopeptide (TPR) repeat protein
MELDLLPLQKKLDQTETKLRQVAERSHNVEDEDLDEEPLSAEELTRIQRKILKEINSREIEIFRVKADRFPTETLHRFELGLRLIKADLVDEAIRELQQVKKDERYAWKAATYLGVCFKKRNNWRLAQRNLEDALAALPPTEEGGRKEVLFQLATGSADNGDLPRAIDLGHELANMDYSFKGIGKLLDDWNDRVQNA